MPYVESARTAGRQDGGCDNRVSEHVPLAPKMPALKEDGQGTRCLLRLANLAELVANAIESDQRFVHDAVLGTTVEYRASPTGLEQGNVNGRGWGPGVRWFLFLRNLHEPLK